MREMDKELVRAWQPIMQGTPPIVFINGKAKANPTVEEIITEYNNSWKEG